MEGVDQVGLGLIAVGVADFVFGVFIAFTAVKAAKARVVVLAVFSLTSLGMIGYGASRLLS